MKRKNVNRKPKRSDIAKRVGNMIGLKSSKLHTGYLTHNDWMQLLSTIETYTDRIKELENATSGNIKS